jgi:hypothetical protein
VKNPIIILFFVNHIQELLELAVQDPLHLLSWEAFAVLENFQPQIAGAALQEHYFPSLTSEILYSPNIKQCLWPNIMFSGNIRFRNFES